jgi:hypothetical protein
MEKLSLNYTPAQLEIFFNSPEKYIIIPKGRRLGVTRGAAQAFIEYALEGISPLLWGDCVYSNIDKYYLLYFLPILKKLPPEIEWNFNKEKRELHINGSYIHMRSADNVDNWEGFGYRKIFLNEAGHILGNDYLYTNAILPMMLDYPESQLIVAGSPKGKTKRNGSEHKFYTLYKRAKENKSGKYKLLQYTSYDNPYLDKEQIDELEAEFRMLGYHVYQQEILGEFIDEIIGGSPFMSAYNPSNHESIEAVYRPGTQVLLIIDFNLNPFCLIFAHMWRDQHGEHFHVFKEIEIEFGSIPVMLDVLHSKQREYPGYLKNCIITGDSMGKNRDISQRDLASHYMKLQRGLGLSNSQLWLPSNPKHASSKVDCNFVLTYFPDFKINPIECPQTCRDMRMVQSDSFGSIIKSNRSLEDQQADFLDCIRYGVNTFLKKWITRKEKNIYSYKDTETKQIPQ